MKPVMIADYNNYMLGVDKLDQFTSYYSFLHKSVKWWRKVFFWVLEVATVNAYIIYKELAMTNGERPMSHISFRRRLITTLSERIRTVVPRARPGPRSADSAERLRPVPHFPQRGTKRRDCVVCSRREEGGTRHLTQYMCGTCSEKPSLCPSDCFQVYHTQRHYNQ